MKNRLLVIIFTFFTIPLMCQIDSYPLYVSYFAPYGVQFGVKVGTSFHLKTWGFNKSDEVSKERHLSISPQIGYFINPNVQNNILLESALDYKWYKSGRKLHFITGIATGYLMGIKKRDGTVNLGSGNISNIDAETVHYFIPTINAGLEKDPGKSLGYYARAFYGRKIASEVEDDAFFGAELGLIFNLFSKTSN